MKTFSVFVNCLIFCEIFTTAFGLESLSQVEINASQYSNGKKCKNKIVWCVSFIILHENNISSHLCCCFLLMCWEIQPFQDNRTMIIHFIGVCFDVLCHDKTALRLCGKFSQKVASIYGLKELFRVCLFWKQFQI